MAATMWRLAIHQTTAAVIHTFNVRVWQVTEPSRVVPTLD
jgi:hypothetical protein